jgi:hypothetical protein
MALNCAARPDVLPWFKIGALSQSDGSAAAGERPVVCSIHSSPSGDAHGQDYGAMEALVYRPR